MNTPERMDRADMGNVGNAQLVNGTPVYDTDGSKVGDVSQYQEGDGYFVMTKGFFFPKDLYVPMSAITRATTDGVFLNLTKDQIKNQNWENPPSQMGTNAMYDQGNATYDQGTAPDMTDQTTRTDQTGKRIDVPVAEEELVANKQRGQVGDVKIHKDVTEQSESIDVPVSHEEVNVREVPASGQAATDIPDNAFQDRTIDVPVYGEQVNVEKQARVTGEVEVDKTRVTQDKRFSDTVRRDEVEVDGPGDQKRVYRPGEMGQDQDQNRPATDDQDVTTNP